MEIGKEGSSTEVRPDTVTTDERRRAVAALLMRPLMTPSGEAGSQAEFMLVRKHATWLKEWFNKHCGWALTVETELARLRKVPGNLDETSRPLRDRQGNAFTRRRYVILCLTLAVLERSERQTVLRKMAEDVAREFAGEEVLAGAGVAFDLSERESRRDFVEVIWHLLDLRVLVRIDGDEQQYLASGEKDVLYNINRAALSAMLNVRRGPSTLAQAAADDRVRLMAEEAYPNMPEARMRRTRIGLMRRLLDDPVVYYEELEEQDRAYFVTQRPFIVKELEAATGLVQEARLEGVAMVDPGETMTDVRMPEEGTDGHSTLLIAEHLANRMRAGKTEAATVRALEQEMRRMIGEYGEYWRKGVQEAGQEAVLLRKALTRLEMLGLIRMNWDEGTVWALPALGRFAVGPVKTKGKESQRKFK